DQLKLFLLGYLNSYLIMVDKNGVNFDSTKNLYLVTGTDQDDEPAVATIDQMGNITIAPVTQQGANVVPGAMTVTSNSVAQGSIQLSVNLALQNTQSGTATNFGVDFYMALTNTFSPSTDTKLTSGVTVPSIGANAS